MGEVPQWVPQLRAWSKGSARGAGPAQIIAAVKVRRIGITTCEHCGGVRYDLGGPHATRFRLPGELVDCAGRPVRNG